jgi:hypothetical protein
VKKITALLFQGVSKHWGKLRKTSREQFPLPWCGKDGGLVGSVAI